MAYDDNESRSRGLGAADDSARSVDAWAVPGVERAGAADTVQVDQNLSRGTGVDIPGTRGVEFRPLGDDCDAVETRLTSGRERFDVRAQPSDAQRPGESGARNSANGAVETGKAPDADPEIGQGPDTVPERDRVPGAADEVGLVPGADFAAMRNRNVGHVGTPGSAVDDELALAMSDRDLLQALQDVGARRRALEAEAAVLAREFAARSSAVAGQESLARRAGFSNVTTATAYLTSSTHTTAKHLLAVGSAVVSGTSLTSEVMPARYPVVKAAVDSAGIATESAALIVEFLDAVDPRVEPDDLTLAETSLVRLAPSLTVPELRKAIRNVAEVIDPDGVEPSAEERHRKRSLRFRELPDGMLELRGVLDIATAMPIKVAVDAITTHWLRDSRGFNRPEDAVTGAVRDETNAVVEGESSPVDVERRTIGQMNADALKMICEHAIGCKEVPDAATTVLVRMNYDDLVAEVDARTGVISAAAAFTAASDGGEGTDGGDVVVQCHGAGVDGVSGVISAGEARRLAASAGIIPAVFGGNSEILDLGRTQRLASPAQRLALAERDGGCAFCGLDPSMCEAHHVEWWQRHDGPTDLNNLILLCSACHHRIHAEEWTVRIVPDGFGVGERGDDCVDVGIGRANGVGSDRPGGVRGIALPTADALLVQPRRPLRFAVTDEVWFIPPTALFPERTPRLGGRKRFQPRLEPTADS